MAAKGRRKTKAATRGKVSTSARSGKAGAPARRRSAAGARTKPASADAAVAPVTLEEAQALARAARPRRAAKRALAPRDASPEEVGDEKERLRQRQAEQEDRRIREYKATLDIMKKRGVKGLAERRDGGRAAGSLRRRRAPGALASARAGQPLQLFAEGDSWFDYPIPFFGGGIIPRLQKRLGVPILNMAKAGDEVRFMLGVEQRLKLEERLRGGCPAGGEWDVLLFSGGGNDIVDHPMALWVRDYDPGRSPARQLHEERFDAAMRLVRAGYEDVIELRDRHSPTTHILFHGYDFAIPDGRGVCRYGPWLKPTFDLRGFPSRKAAADVVKAMLEAFAIMLRTLSGQHARVTFVEGQGTLAAGTGSWHNELHPTAAGFDRFAELFAKELKRLFPDRIP